MSKRTVYVITSFDRGGNAGHVVECIFNSREDADRFLAQDTHAGETGWSAGPYEIEERTLYDAWDAELEPYSYWQRIAHVYPDRTKEEWTKEHRSEGPFHMPAVDDHLKPWDGHTQGHCGLHISVLGSDRDAVERAFQEHIVIALGQCNGTCPRCGRTARYQRDWRDWQS